MQMTGLIVQGPIYSKFGKWEKDREREREKEKREERENLLGWV